MEKKNINTTLILIMENNKILLARKKRGFAMGSYNGIGGKQDPGETIEQAMIRETQEEIGVTPIDYKQVGLIKFDMWYKGEPANLNLNIFTCTKFEGKICETEEMLPKWFDKGHIPFEQMLPDDVAWFPLVLDGNCVAGDVFLSKDLKTSKHNISKVSEQQLENIIKKTYSTNCLNIKNN